MSADRLDDSLKNQLINVEAALTSSAIATWPTTTSSLNRTYERVSPRSDPFSLRLLNGFRGFRRRRHRYPRGRSRLDLGLCRLGSNSSFRGWRCGFLARSPDRFLVHRGSRHFRACAGGRLLA